MLQCKPAKAATYVLQCGLPGACSARTGNMLRPCSNKALLVVAHNELPQSRGANLRSCSAQASNSKGSCRMLYGPETQVMVCKSRINVPQQCEHIIERKE